MESDEEPELDIITTNFIEVHLSRIHHEEAKKE